MVFKPLSSRTLLPEESFLGFLNNTIQIKEKLPWLDGAGVWGMGGRVYVQGCASLQALQCFCRTLGFHGTVFESTDLQAF